ncbi:MAG: pyridoxal 5'-phosphate synthase glutaminase subunit PdxT [Actinomycetia bacterium]|nr:pyridoxal 5'-phosphate synthase glutaminase subunit PdxT [Actinomycetes bacterium]
MIVGVLALQGDFREHIAILSKMGVDAEEIRTPEELAAVDALVIPGGESTTIGRLAEVYGLIGPIQSRCEAGMPVLGTCAGMIFLASSTADGDQAQLGVLDACVRRNAFGRQFDSFEADLEVVGLDEPMHAVFIRAPWMEKIGADVEVLASVIDTEGESHPVLVREGRILATSFHPELTGDERLHRMLVDLVDDI